MFCQHLETRDSCLLFACLSATDYSSFQSVFALRRIKTFCRVQTANTDGRTREKRNVRMEIRTRARGQANTHARTNELNVSCETGHLLLLFEKERKSDDKTCSPALAVCHPFRREIRELPNSISVVLLQRIRHDVWLEERIPFLGPTLSDKRTFWIDNILRPGLTPAIAWHSRA